MIKLWTKLGEPRMLAKRHGKHLVAQRFIDSNYQECDWTLVQSERHWSSVVLPITAEGMVIAIQQFRFGSERIEVELPCGNRDGDERPFDTAVRELLEETGYRPQEMIALMPHSQIWTEPSSSNLQSHPFIAFGCEKVRHQALDPMEDIEVIHIPLLEWIRMSLGGEIDDAKSIVTTHKALPYLKEKFHIAL